MIIFDCEIVKGILGKNDTPIDGIEYCNGWDDHKGMGISCICAYDYPTNVYRVFCQDNLNEFQKLIRAFQFYLNFNIIFTIFNIRLMLLVYDFYEPQRSRRTQRVENIIKTSAILR